MPFFDTIRAGASGASADYEIQRSLRFNDGDSPSLTRSPSGSGNQSTFTFSWWQKITQPNDYPITFSCGSTSITTGFWEMRIGSVGLYLRFKDSSTVVLNSRDIFRDPSAWYHCVIAVDTTQATSSNRIKMYVNNRQITSFEYENYPSQNFNSFRVNSTDQHQWGYGKSSSGAVDGPLDSYLAEINFIDGQQLTPSSFAETDATTGQWNPIDTSGLTFGTNGYRLQFADNSGTTATTLGKDTSGQGNNFTPNNFSVSAGSGNDSVEDTPTNNFSTFSPLLTDQRTDAVYSEGNTKVVTGSGAGIIGNTFAVDSGKWYAEFKCTAKTSVNMGVGIQTVKGYDGERQWNESQNGGFGIAYVGGDNEHSGKRATDGGGLTSYGASYVVDDIIGVALDVDNKTVNFYKNNSAQGTIDITTTKGDSYVISVGHGQGSCTNTWEGNFGQRAFSYTPPTGFVAMNSQNLPDPTIKLPNKYFDTLLYTGNGSGQTLSGLNFSPDWLWIKSRSSTEDHQLNDQVRGTLKSLSSDSTSAENTASGRIEAFTSDGFTVGNSGNVNSNSETFVAWNWNAGGSTVTNNDGSVASEVRANTSAGFSIVTFSGSGNRTIGHGLGVAPQVIIMKGRNVTDQWTVGHHKLDASNPWHKGIPLNTNATTQDNAGFWNDTAPTSTVFSKGTWDDGYNMVAYCFSEVAGYSKFGSYTGNGNSNGTFVFTGFRPSWVLVKDISNSYSWDLHDNKRDPHNVTEKSLAPNLTNAEDTYDAKDFLSNGFKLRSSSNSLNKSGDTYIYLAFAESPFKYARAR